MDKRIQLILDSRHLGGIESHVITLCKAFEANEIDFQLVLYKVYQPSSFVDKLDQEKIQYIDARGSLKRLYQLIDRHRDVIHTHGYKASLIGKCLAKLKSVRCVSTYHAGETGSGLVKFYSQMDDLLSRFSVNIAVSQDIAKRIHQPIVMDNFIQIPELLTTSKHGIGFVGRLSEEKQPQHFLDLARAFPEQQFHLYGDGALREQITQQAPTNLTVHGHIANQELIWESCDIICMTSQAEGLPYTALEAMANEKILCSYAVGGLQKLISNQKNGYLIEPQNLDAFKSQLASCFAMSEEEKRIVKQQARGHIINQYSTEACLQKLLPIYQDER